MNAMKILLSVALMAGMVTAVGASSVKLIVDTDMYTDIDSGAVALAHVLADRGECELLGVISSTGGGSPAAGMIRLINASYGRADLPVGAPKHIFVGPENDKTCLGPQGAPAVKSPHLRQFSVAVRGRPDLAKYVRSDAAPDSVEVYRRLLAAQPDGSVTICTIGFLTNTRLLLASGPDAISPLSGRELVAKKVRKLWAMAFKWPKGAEYNIRMDAISSAITFFDWPTPVEILDFYYGYGMRCGLPMASQPKVGFNPAQDVYAEAIEKNLWGKRTGHPAWDEVTVLFAVRGWERYCTTIRGRFDIVSNKGDNVWTDDPEGPHLMVREKMPRKEVCVEVDELLTHRPKNGLALEPDFWRGFDNGDDVLADAAYGTPRFVPTPGGRGLCGCSPAWHQIGHVGSAFTVVVRCKAASEPGSILLTLGKLQGKDDALMLVTDSAKALKVVTVRGTDVKDSLAVPVADAGALHTYALRGENGAVTVAVDGLAMSGRIAYRHASDTLQLLGGYNKHDKMPAFSHGCGAVEGNKVVKVNEANVIDDIKIYYRRILPSTGVNR